MASILLESNEFFWFCVKCKPRQESVAKRSILRDVGAEVFCPMLRFERARRSGRVRVTEAMFPGYLFSRFNYRDTHRHLAACHGVSHLVKFGGIAAIVDEEIIRTLREQVVDKETVEIRTQIEVGSEVQVLQGAFTGIKAIVTQVLPAQERVKVLLELLGMEREVEIAESGVLPRILHPLAAV